MLQNILNIPSLYKLFNVGIGVNQLRQFLDLEHIHSHPQCTILDLGCGTGNMVPYLKFSKYVGIDLSPANIRSAKAKYKKNVQFISCSADKIDNVLQGMKFDRVLGIGLLHHLSDDLANETCRIVKQQLNPDGMFITSDGVYRDKQSLLKKLLLFSDRGSWVRTQPLYEKILKVHFSNVTSYEYSGLIRIPYDHLVTVSRP